jgi:hypothetical protein
LVEEKPLFVYRSKATLWTSLLKEAGVTLLFLLALGFAYPYVNIAEPFVFLALYIAYSAWNFWKSCNSAEK